MFNTPGFRFGGRDLLHDRVLQRTANSRSEPRNGSI
jgi:hypothetical protein